MYEDKGISELYAMQDAVMMIFKRVAKAEEGESVWSILADMSNEINQEIDRCFTDMEIASKYGG